MTAIIFGALILAKLEEMNRRPKRAAALRGLAVAALCVYAWVVLT